MCSVVRAFPLLPPLGAPVHVGPPPCRCCLCVQEYTLNQSWAEDIFKVAYNRLIRALQDAQFDAFETVLEEAVDAAAHEINISNDDLQAQFKSWGLKKERVDYMIDALSKKLASS